MTKETVADVVREMRANGATVGYDYWASRIQAAHAHEVEANDAYIREADRRISELASLLNQANVDRLREVEALRDKNRALHRRCQDAEAALADYRKIIAIPPDGDGVRFVSGSMGRALLVGLCHKQEAEVEALRLRLAEMENCK